MSALIVSPQRTLLRRYLLSAYLLLIVYASLSPFSGWQELGLDYWEVLVSPLAQTYTTFDALLNVAAYLPLGFLLLMTLRERAGTVPGLIWATLLGLLLSASLEYLQIYLPTRASSNTDVLSNGTGVLAGALLALAVMNRAWFLRLTQQRIDLFRRGDGVDFGLMLVMLWMFAQINPTLPMLGNVFITEAAYRIFSGMPHEPFNIWMCTAVVLNLLMIGLLLRTLLRNTVHVLVALLVLLGGVALAKFLAAAILLKSWALLLWLNSEAMLGIFFGLLLMWGISLLRVASLLWIAAIVAGAYLALVLLMNAGTPAEALRLYYWRYGHMRNFNGMSQAVSILFPLLFGVYLAWARKRI